MPSYSRRKFLAIGGASATLGIAGYQTDGYTKARVMAILSPLPGIRATGEPIAVQRKVTSRNVEYLPESNLVRIVTARNSDGAVEYATRSFKHWAKLECGSIAADEIRDPIAAAFGAAESDVMSGMGFENAQPFITTAPTGQAVTRKEIVTQLPNHVTVTITFAEKEYTTDVPVVVGKRREVELL